MVESLFSKIKAVFNPTGRGAGEKDPPKASEYVDWLPSHMLRSSCTELTIDSSCPLPGADESSLDKIPPCLPDPEIVINRIKVLCGLNPFRFPEPMEGIFEREYARHTLKFRAQFDDRENQCVCTLHLSVHTLSV